MLNSFSFFPFRSILSFPKRTVRSSISWRFMNQMSKAASDSSSLVLRSVHYSALRPLSSSPLSSPSTPCPSVPVIPSSPLPSPASLPSHSFPRGTYSRRATLVKQQNFEHNNFVRQQIESRPLANGVPNRSVGIKGIKHGSIYGHGTRIEKREISLLSVINNQPITDAGDGKTKIQSITARTNQAISRFSGDNRVGHLSSYKYEVASKTVTVETITSVQTIPDGQGGKIPCRNIGPRYDGKPGDNYSPKKALVLSAAETVTEDVTPVVSVKNATCLGILDKIHNSDIITKNYR